MAEFAGQWGPEGIEYPNGQQAINTPYEVRSETGFLVPLFADHERTVTKPNPGLTDNFGNLFFFANPGTYELSIGTSLTLPIVVNLHPDEPTSGGGGVGGYEHTVNAPMALVQIVHGLPWKPGGVTSIDSLGILTDYETITHPSPGVTEIYYGGQFGPGKVYLS